VRSTGGVGDAPVENRQREAGEMTARKANRNQVLRWQESITSKSTLCGGAGDRAAEA
jgi:hypothetical protein